MNKWRTCQSVTLTEEDWLHAATLAFKRDESYRKSCTFSSRLFRHFQGCVAELAAANNIGVDVDEKIYASGDNGYDFIVNDLTIDVKSTTHTPPNLMVPVTSLSADVYLATYVENNTVFLIGSAWNEDVRSKSTIAGCHRVSVDDLRDWPSVTV